MGGGIVGGLGGAGMARSMTPTEMVGYGLSGATALGAWLYNRRKTDIDESALVLGKWKELVETHQSAIKDIREEFAAYKASAITEITDLRSRLTQTEAGLARANKRIGELEAENAGLKRAIAQNSQSTAMMLGRTRQRATDGESRMTGMEDEIAKLDQAGHNSGAKE